MDGSKEEVIRGHQGDKLQPGRHRRLGFLKHLVDGGIHLGGVGTGGSEHNEHSTRTVLYVRREVVAHGTNLHISHVAQVQYSATTGA